MNAYWGLALLAILLLACDSPGAQIEPGQSTSTVASGHRLEFLLDKLGDPNSTYVMVAAHRGDWLWAPENSLRGFQNCIEAGVDMLEIDVRLSKDSIPVVIHDLTLDRTTDGTGNVGDWPLDSLRQLRLKQTAGGWTEEKIPTLEEVMLLAKDRVLVYVDKSVDKVGHILPVLEQTGTLHQTVFVLDFPYRQAQAVFGDYLDQVIYSPVVDNQREDLDQYLSEILDRGRFKVFQFRIDQPNTPAHLAIPRVMASGAKLFVAATWPQHTMGHDDQVSRTQPDEGWGWLVENGFSILETNRPYELLRYLEAKGWRD